MGWGLFWASVAEAERHARDEAIRLRAAMRPSKERQEAAVTKAHDRWLAAAVGQPSSTASLN